MSQPAWFNHPIRLLVQMLTDVLAFVLAGFWAYAWGRYLLKLPAFDLDNDVQAIRATLYGGLCVVWVFWFGWVRQGYSRPQPLWHELYRIFKGVIALAVLDMALVAIVRLDFSRTWWASAWLALLVLLPLSRLLARKLLSTVHLWQRPTLIFGTGHNAAEAYLALQGEPSMGFDVHGFVHVPTAHGINQPESTQPPQTLLGLPVLPWAPGQGSQPCQAGSLRINRHTHLVVALEANAQDERDQLLSALSRLHSRHVHVVPAMRGVPLFGLEVSHFFRHELLMVHVRNNLANPLHRAIKRAFDVVGALVLLVLLGPVMLWVAWRIARASGWPVIFSQPRVGQGGRHFKFYKFRSMVPNAEALLREWEQTNSAQWKHYVANNFKLDDDPRVIGIGPFIRRTSIDELPQLWNVLKGDMSLVGPRPLLPREVADYGDDIQAYQVPPPGITGLWQISGRSQTTFQDRVDFDVWYVKNWSLWTDITILFKTVGVVLGRSGAY